MGSKKPVTLCLKECLYVTVKGKRNPGRKAIRIPELMSPFSIGNVTTLSTTEWLVIFKQKSVINYNYYYKKGETVIDSATVCNQFMKLS